MNRMDDEEEEEEHPASIIGGGDVFAFASGAIVRIVANSNLKSAKFCLNFIITNNGSRRNMHT